MGPWLRIHRLIQQNLKSLDRFSDFTNSDLHQKKLFKNKRVFLS